MLHQEQHGRLAFEGSTSRQTLVQNGGDRVDVGGWRDGFALGTFGRDVLGRSENEAGLGGHGTIGPVEARDAEVEDFDEIGIISAANQHDVEGFLAHAGADARYEDRRKVLHDEGPSRPEVIRALFEMTTGWRLESEPVAIRGSRLGLTRDSYRDMTDVTQPITMEHLTLLEVGDDNLGRYLALFDTDDLEAGFAELDARYTTGEAAAHAHTWSVITAGYAALNHHEIPPTTPDWVNIDHRRVTPFAPGDQIPYIRASWEDTPDLAIYIEAVLRLNDRGAVFTSATHGTSREGFDAEWRAIGIITIEGDLIARCELFDETDIDAALARFEELSPARAGGTRSGPP